MDDGVYFGLHGGVVAIATSLIVVNQQVQPAGCLDQLGKVRAWLAAHDGPEPVTLVLLPGAGQEAQHARVVDVVAVQPDGACKSGHVTGCRA